MSASRNGAHLAGDRSGRGAGRIAAPSTPVDPATSEGRNGGHRVALRPDPRGADTVPNHDSAATNPLARTRRILELLFGPVSARAFGVELWDGQSDGPGLGGGAPFVLVLPRPSALREMLLLPSELRLGAAFVNGAFDVKGDLEAAAPLMQTLRCALMNPSTAVRVLWHLRRLPRRTDLAEAMQRLDPSIVGTHGKHSLTRDSEAVRAHYDVGNDFYALWLDRDLVYSCAYFETGLEDIDTAQRAKLDHLCRKLRLKPGERLLDIGCGWGALVRHAATHFGVVAVGVTLSEAQAAVANARIKTAGLTERCAVLVRDYRAQLGIYFNRVFDLLRPGGLFLNHGIVRRPDTHPIREAVRRAIWREGLFIDRYVFPDGELVPVGEIMTRAETTGFEVRDVESLREHYVRTLRLWVRRLIESDAAARCLVGEPVYRTWYLYMSASAARFADGTLGLTQVLFAKPDANGAVRIPATRGDLYGLPVRYWGPG